MKQISFISKMAILADIENISTWTNFNYMTADQARLKFKFDQVMRKIHLKLKEDLYDNEKKTY